MQLITMLTPPGRMVFPHAVEHHSISLFVAVHLRVVATCMQGQYSTSIHFKLTDAYLCYYLYTACELFSCTKPSFKYTETDV
jgi:hypothetical protein